MTSKLIIATATVLAITIAAPVGTLAFAQESSAPKMEGMKKEGMSEMEGMKKEGMSEMQGMQKKAGMQGKKGKMGKKGRHGKKGMGMQGMQGMGMQGMQRMMKMRKKMMGKMFVVREKAYTNDDLKRMIDGRLAKFGFSRIRAGDVKDGSGDGPKTALVDVVSAKGEYLFRVEVNRKNATAKIID